MNFLNEGGDLAAVVLRFSQDLSRSANDEAGEDLEGNDGGRAIAE